MAKVTKTIGKLPVFKDAYVQGRVYSRLNQVTHLGSTFQSKMDNNTSVPGEVVNNELVVSSNWVIISNGTAAYLAGNRLTDVEKKTAQLERDLNTLRGDVQGVSTNTPFILKQATSKCLHMVVNVLSLPEGSASTHLMFATQGNIRVGSIFRNGSIQFNIWVDGVEYYSSLTKSFKIGDLISLTYSFDTTNLGFWVNGVFIKMNMPSDVASKINLDFAVNKIDTNIYTAYYSVRSFNILPSETQIEQLYNQGRCDEVVLGDEWRAGNNFNHSNTIANVGDNKASITEVLTGIKKGCLNKIVIEKPTTIGGLTILIMKGTASSDGYDNLSAPAEAGVYTFDYISVAENQRLGFRCDNASTPFDIKLSINTANILNEYLPQYLTGTKWIDNGVSKQDIPYTAPTFSYIKPYKQYNYGSGAPSTPPVAAFTEYGDMVSGDIWKCKPKGCDRQFSVSDWKQINN